MPRIPFGPIRVEYRGVAPAGDFVTDAGEKVEYGPKLKFELSLADGDVEVVVIGQKVVDKASDFDSAQLVKGDELMVEGVVSYGTGKDGGGYAGLKPLSIRRVPAKASVKAA